MSPQEYDEQFRRVMSAFLPGFTGFETDREVWVLSASAVPYGLAFFILSCWGTCLTALWRCLGGVFEDEESIATSMLQLSKCFVRYDLRRQSFDLFSRGAPLSGRLFEEISFDFFHKMLEQVHIIHDLEQARGGFGAQLSLHCRFSMFEANQIVLNEGEPADELIVVRKGSVRLLFHTQDPSMEEVHSSNSMAKNSVLGELEIVVDLTRSYAIQSREAATELMIVSKAAFLEVSDIHHIWTKVLQQKRHDIMQMLPPEDFIESPPPEPQMSVHKTLSAASANTTLSEQCRMSLTQYKRLQMLSVSCPHCNDSQSLFFFLNVHDGDGNSAEDASGKNNTTSEPSNSATPQKRTSIMPMSMGASFGLGKKKQGFKTFLSHSWDEGMLTHRRAEQIAAGLNKAGFPVWLDTDGGCNKNITNDICGGIDNSETFTMIITKEYLEKVQSGTGNYCGAEFSYAVLRKGVSHMICIVIDPAMRKQETWFGPVAFRCGNDLFIDFSGVQWDVDNREATLAEVLEDKNFTKSLALLTKRLERITQQDKRNLELSKVTRPQGLDPLPPKSSPSSRSHRASAINVLNEKEKRAVQINVRDYKSHNGEDEVDIFGEALRPALPTSRRGSRRNSGAAHQGFHGRKSRNPTPSGAASQMNSLGGSQMGAMQSGQFAYSNTSSVRTSLRSHTYESNRLTPEHAVSTPAGNSNLSIRKMKSEAESEYSYNGDPPGKSPSSVSHTHSLRSQGQRQSLTSVSEGQEDDKSEVEDKQTLD